MFVRYLAQYLAHSKCSKKIITIVNMDERESEGVTFHNLGFLFPRGLAEVFWLLAALTHGKSLTYEKGLVTRTHNKEPHPHTGCLS